MCVCAALPPSPLPAPQNPRSGIARQINGHFSVPTYLSTLLPVPGSTLVINPTTGLPVFQAMSVSAM